LRSGSGPSLSAVGDWHRKGAYWALVALSKLVVAPLIAV